MAIVDPNALKAVCKLVHEKMAFDVFGELGTGAVFDIMEVLWKVYQHVEPELLTQPVIVIRSVQTGAAGPTIANAEPFSDFSLLSQRTTKGFILQVVGDGTYNIASVDAATPTDLASWSVVYEYTGSAERFLAGNQSADVIKLDPTAKSQFCIPTFTTLRGVLNHYAVESVRHSSCPTFDTIWADKHRIFLKPKPEVEMRRSLTWFLKVRLGAGHEVRPEQVMDESHPVDIKVTQMNSNRLAIVEIKWLGDSRGEDGNITVQHRDQRAKEGAQQLAGYLDMNRKQAPLHITKGYYVIIDARRRGLKPETQPETVTKDQGYHYTAIDIDFDPKWHETRDDFETPYRMFAEPLCGAN